MEECVTEDICYSCNENQNNKLLFCITCICDCKINEKDQKTLNTFDSRYSYCLNK